MGRALQWFNGPDGKVVIRPVNVGSVKSDIILGRKRSDKLRFKLSEKYNTAKRRVALQWRALGHEPNCIGERLAIEDAWFQIRQAVLERYVEKALAEKA